MKKIIYPTLLIVSLFLNSCEGFDMNFDNPQAPDNTYTGNGTVAKGMSGHCDQIIINNSKNSCDIYDFSLDGGKTPESQGFHAGDYVYFEAEVGQGVQNTQGGTTYHSKLKLIKNA